MSRSDELRQRALAIRARDQQAAEPEPVATPPRPRPGKPRTVRQTVDLTPDQHNALAAWRLDAAMALDRGRLSTQEVLATLVAVLLDDETVARRVRARLDQ